MSDIVLNNGAKMPILGLGTWQANDAEIDKTIDCALKAGYRHIDTAYVYQNEAAIGKSLKRWLDSGKINREDLFVVTKLPPTANRSESVGKMMDASLKSLQLDYVDLYLVHMPCGLLEGEKEPVLKDETKDTNSKDEAGKPLLDLATDHLALWKAMEAQVDAGKARAIGLSNFNQRQIERIVKAARIKPANLQVELHVYFQQRELVTFCQQHNISVVAYGPIGSPGLPAFLDKAGGNSENVKKQRPLVDPVVVAIAAAHGKTAAQVLLRHTMQRGIAVIPKSTDPGRIKQNFEVFDFELNKEEMEQLNNLDQGPNGRMFRMDFLKMEAHPEFPF